MSETAERDILTLEAEEVANPEPIVEQDLTAATEPTPPAVVSEGPASLLSAIVQMASDPRVDADKLEKLLAMQERMEARDAEQQFNEAMMRLPPIHVKKNGRIDLTSKEDRAKGLANQREVPFARWEDMAAIIEPILEREGFRISFNSAPRQADGGGLVVTGTLLHRAGHSRSATMPLPLDTGPGRNNLQANGSTLSYGKRYTTEMLLNIVRDGDDDDGKKGGEQFITPEQAEEIAVLVDEANADPALFMQWVFGDNEPHNYREIPSDGFVRVVNALKSKIRTNKETKA